MQRVEETIIRLLEESDKPITQKVMIDKLRVEGYEMTKRKLRTHIKRINEKYLTRDIDCIIVGTKLGNELTTDFHKIKRFNNARRHHALSELYMSYQTQKRLMNDQNLTFQDFVRKEEGL